MPPTFFGKLSNSGRSSPRPGLGSRNPSLKEKMSSEKGSLQVEQLKETIKLEIRRELKIKEGAENLRKVSTDKKTLTQCNQAIKDANNKLADLHEHLQELNAHISDDIVLGSYAIVLCVFSFLSSFLSICIISLQAFKNYVG